MWCPKFYSDPAANGSPSLDETARETAQNLHAKASKLEAALMAAHLDDTRKLMRADRQKVRLLEKERLGIDTGDEDDVGDITVTDDYHIHHDRGSLGRVLLGAVLGMVLVGGPALAWFLAKATQPSSSTGVDTDSAYVIDIGKEPVE